MLPRLCLFAIFLAALGLTAAPADEPAKGTPIKLFNGQDFTGWRKWQPPRETANLDEVWTVQDGVIRCLGKPAGYIITEQDYGDYELTFEWKWGAKPGNSGCFVHVSGPDMIWPKGVEAQLMHQRAGDFWLVGDFKLSVDPARFDRPSGRHYFHLKDGVEKPAGEWNKYRIRCDGNTIKLWVNDVFQNEGTDAEMAKGKILLQSEGAEIFFRNIVLTPLR
jgi:hypothetical protein